ncbi:MAG: lasso peptide biosynthesis B2 protein [Gemmataceae bacterium]
MTHSPALVLAPGVYLAWQEDMARVLDLERGRFFGLDGTASEMVALGLHHDMPHVCARMAERYDLDADTLRADLEGLLADLHRQGLLAASRRPRRAGFLGWLTAPGRASGPITPALVGRLLRRAWWSLRLTGWAPTLRRWSQPYATPSSPAPTDLPAQVDAAIREAASAQLLFPVACKERALVAFHLLRAVHGLPAELIIGVQHYPFLAHAWVEFDGQTLTDDRAHCDNFEPVARFT